MWIALCRRCEPRANAALPARPTQPSEARNVNMSLPPPPQAGGGVAAGLIRIHADLRQPRKHRTRNAISRVGAAVARRFECDIVADFRLV